MIESHRHPPVPARSVSAGGFGGSPHGVHLVVDVDDQLKPIVFGRTLSTVF